MRAVTLADPSGIMLDKIHFVAKVTKGLSHEHSSSADYSGEWYGSSHHALQQDRAKAKQE